MQKELLLCPPVQQFLKDPVLLLPVDEESMPALCEEKMEQSGNMTTLCRSDLMSTYVGNVDQVS